MAKKRKADSRRHERLLKRDVQHDDTRKALADQKKAVRIYIHTCVCWQLESLLPCCGPTLVLRVRADGLSSRLQQRCTGKRHGESVKTAVQST